MGGPSWFSDTLGTLTGEIEGGGSEIGWLDWFRKKKESGYKFFGCRYIGFTESPWFGSGCKLVIIRRIHEQRMPATAMEALSIITPLVRWLIGMSDGAVKTILSSRAEALIS